MNIKREEQKVKLDYQKTYHHSKAYVVTIDDVYEGFENFTTKKVDYEIKDTDLEFLKESGLNITPKDFEKAIDAFEKIAKMTKNQGLEHM